MARARTKPDAVASAADKAAKAPPQPVDVADTDGYQSFCGSEAPATKG